MIFLLFLRDTNLIIANKNEEGLRPFSLFSHFPPFRLFSTDLGTTDNHLSQLAANLSLIFIISVVNGPWKRQDMASRRVLF